MKALLDTNILIHREARTVINEEIGTLFGWLDRLNYEKCIHSLSLAELEKHLDASVVKTMQTKLKNYNTLKTEAPEVAEITAIRNKYDRSESDYIDTSLLKELFCKRVGCLITEDRKIHDKAAELGISDLVYTIDGFLEKVTNENPDLSDYKVLSVKKEHFGNIDCNDLFFDSFRTDYEEFNQWFNKKADEVAYICRSENSKIIAFLYVKKEGVDENYNDIEPAFTPKKRLKIGTLKVNSNGYKIGERFLKIIFDNALQFHVDEIYVTLFKYSLEQNRLTALLIDWGFREYGVKKTNNGAEKVLVRDFRPYTDNVNPILSYPYINSEARKFIVPIYPEYHTELFPDSILRTESPLNFVENAPHRNAIQKVFISRSIFRDLLPGDIVVFYRTGGKYKGVVTTIGVVDSVVNNIRSVDDFIRLCRKRSVFNDAELKEQWDFKPRYRPFVVNFLYVYSFPKRPNLNQLIDLKIIKDISSAPRGFEQISDDHFKKILKVSESNENFIIN
jgi:hypothetical protein